MLKATNLIAVLLILLGAGAFIFSSSSTALLPAYVGTMLLVVVGLSVAFATARKQLMHSAMVVAVFGTLSSAATLAFRSAQMNTLAITVNVGMLVLCGALLALQIRSFAQARRAPDNGL